VKKLEHPGTYRQLRQGQHYRCSRCINDLSPVSGPWDVVIAISQGLSGLSDTGAGSDTKLAGLDGSEPRNTLRDSSTARKTAAYRVLDVLP
jgi:hypothetical protein